MRFNDIDSMPPSQMDFVPRERRNQILKLIIAFTTTIALVFISAYAPVFNNSWLYAPLVVIIILMVLCVYVVYRKQLSLDLVMNTEYQNLLFSQAATIGTSFCIFVRRDGAIVYADQGLGKVFPRFDYSESQALEGMFEQGNVRKADRARILAAIMSHTSDSLIFPVFQLNGDKKDYIINVEPLSRPSGYCVIRGREYLGQRSGMQLMPDVLRSTSIDKLDHMLATTSVAHYTTDGFGKLEYANPAFARLFGYTPEELMEAGLSIHHLIVSFGQQVLTEEYSISEYSGDAVLLHRQGQQLQATVQQQVIRDVAGKAAGATGTVLMPATA